MPSKDTKIAIRLEARERIWQRQGKLMSLWQRPVTVSEAITWLCDQADKQETVNDDAAL